MITSARMTRSEAEDFLYREAGLLDERQLEEWERLFTPDGIYWLPMYDGAEGEPTLLHDSPEQRAMRIHQLIHRAHLAQVPPSRTVHVVSNVQVEELAGPEVRVRCNAVIYEVRPGDHQELQIGVGRPRSMVARCEYRLRHHDGWQIAEKKLLLLDRDLPLYNLTFIL